MIVEQRIIVLIIGFLSLLIIYIITLNYKQNYSKRTNEIPPTSRDRPAVPMNRDKPAISPINTGNSV